MSGYKDFLNEITGGEESAPTHVIKQEIPVQPVEQLMISFDEEELTVPDPEPSYQKPPTQRIPAQKPVATEIDFDSYTGYRLTPSDHKELWIEAFEKSQKSVRVGELVKKLKDGEFLIDKDGTINPISKILNAMGDDSEPAAFFAQKWTS